MILLQTKTLPTSGSTRKHVLCLPAHTHPQPAELLPLFAATLAWVCSLHFLFFGAERAIWTHSQGDNGGKRGQIDHTRIFQVFKYTVAVVRELWPTACFCKQSFTATQPFLCVLSTVPAQQNWIVVAETIWPKMQKILCYPWQKKFFDP